MAAVLKPKPEMSQSAQRFEWRSRFGVIVIEVVGEDIYVAGKRVERVEQSRGEDPGQVAQVSHTSTDR